MTISFHQIKHFIIHWAKARRGGHGVHSPFAYQLCEEVFYNINHFYNFEELKKIRAALLTNTTEITVEDFGAGSKTFTSNKRKINELAQKGVSTSLQSETFYKLINFLNSNTCIELGTSIGLNTLYLAMANKNGRVFTIEGSKSLTALASALAKESETENIEFINAKFDDALPSLLQKINSLDLLYVDGNHTYEATLRYFNLALAKKNNSSVFIFDDIYWSPGMTKAWNEIKQHPAVTLSIDTFYFGMLFFKEEIKEKVDLKFYL